MKRQLISFSSLYKILVSLTIFSLLATAVKATHIRAAEITVERIGRPDEFKYRFTVTAIRDTGSTIPFGQGVFSFGDGNSIDGDFNVQIDPLGDELEKNVFVVEHTYSAPSASYIVSYREENRNEGILNMDNSVNTPFYVESQIRIDPFFGINNSPIMTVLPVDKGGQYVTFFHNPGAFDPDGDSLSYRLTTPKQNDGLDVFGYVLPNDPSFYEDFTRGNEEQTDVPTFDLDPITGTLTWDAPDEPGEYNVAFVVEEWRKISGEWFKLGFVTRDMQIIIEETDNEKPELQIPEELCVEAGEVINEVILGTDVDGHPVLIEAFGGPFEVPSPASLDTIGFQNVPARVNFTWNTECGHVRERPYEVIFKITDDPPAGPKLVNFETWFVTIVGPAPEGLEVATQPNETMSLTWDSYECTNADSLEVWRRVDSYEFDIDDCQVGMPAFAGYEMIDLLSASETSYIDNNGGLGLAPGAKYCYRLVARFPDPEGGLSYVSEEACDSLVANGPVITNVDIDVTGEDNGEIIVRWAPPFDLDDSAFPPPFQYDIIRSDGQVGEVNRTTVARVTDTMFVDTGLNTLAQSYNYKVILLDGNGVELDSSATASSVRLELSPLFESIELRWGANVPWSNRPQDFPYHYIYRDRSGGSSVAELTLIDSVNVSENGFFYLDNGDFNDEPLSDSLEYCYYVVTQGVYGNQNIIEPLINRSELICAQPNDTISPCTPVAFQFDPDFTCEALIAGGNCNFTDFTNHLLWEQDGNSECDNDIQSYNVYFSGTGNVDDFEVIDNVVTTEYFHENLPSLKGCYRITAVDRSGNESIPTEIFCNDNCPQYLLPNAFSPNGDSWNEFFTPLTSGSNCPRFIESVVLLIFDRTGNKVFEYDSQDSESSILINWDGKTNSGVELPAGTYFYTADVTYDVLENQDDTEQLKGWIQLMK